MKLPRTLLHRIMFFVVIIGIVLGVVYATVSIVIPANISVTPIATPTTSANISVTPIVTPPTSTNMSITPIALPITPRPFPPLTQLQKDIQRYRNYRTRFESGFIYVTSTNDPGSNLPASKTHAFAGRNSEYIDFGDTTSLMGFYMGTLATEYKLLKNEGKDATKTLKELLYAIKAIERLDLHAESYFGGTNSTNGFFIRNDVPSFRYPTCNAGLGNFINPFAVHFGVGITKIGYNYGGSCDARGDEMSEDQVRTMLLGLSLVKKLVTEPTIAINGEQVNFQNRVSDLTTRIIKYMQVTETKKIGPITITYKRWRIKNPVTGVLVERGSMGGPDMMAGFSYGFAKDGQEVTNQNLDWHDAIDPERAISQLIFGALGTANITKFQQLLTQAGIPFHAYNLFGGFMLGTIANLRGSKTVDITYNNNYPFMGMVYYLLYNDSSSKDKLNNEMSFFQNQLDSAPDEGPYNFGGNDRPASNDRTSQNLLKNPEERGTIPTSDANLMRQQVGAYNGLDYMLLHNLFLLTYKDKLAPFTF